MLALAALAAAALALGAPQTPPAAAAPRPQQETQLEDIIVNGRPLQDLVGDFVEEISRPASDRGLARWHDRVCVGVVNLSPVHAQSMVDRISDVAAGLGLEPGLPGCTPQVVVVATVDAPALATALVTARHHAFNLGSHQTDAGSRALRAFETSDAPVRWWHTSLPVDSDNGQLAIRLPGMLGADGQPTAPAINVFAASRLNSQVRDDLSRVVIIIDVDKLGDTTFAQLEDYVALLALAQIDADAQTQDYDTIMNLFRGPGAPVGLTDWDMGYLKALYSTHPERTNPNDLTRQVVTDVVRQRRAADRAAETPPQ